MQCGEGRRQKTSNWLGERDVCGKCGKTDLQDTFEVCSSSHCLGSDEHMFHAGCMVAVGEDTYQCQVCFDAGAPLESDISSDHDSVLSADVPRGVEQHKNVFVGMPYFSGHVMEIYPDLDKVTVKIDHGTASCEIQHLNLSKVVQKVSDGSHIPKQINVNELDCLD